jgi:hypothetical protein
MLSTLPTFSAEICSQIYNHAGAKRSPFVVAGLLWKPFDARFEDILDDFRFHGDVMDRELKLVQLDDTKKLQETTETMAGKKDISEITRRLLELNQRIDAAGRIRQEREMPDANNEALRRRYKGRSEVSDQYISQLN